MNDFINSSIFISAKQTNIQWQHNKFNKVSQATRSANAHHAGHL